MAHIHKLIDFTVSAYVVFEGKVLLIDHKLLKKWLPLGGHIELDEDPDQALIREIKEESGLDVTVLSDKPEIVQEGAKFLYNPHAVTVHNINSIHKHVDLIYFCRALTDKISLAETEHNDIKWFSKKDINDPKYKLEQSVKIYSKKALEKAGH